MDYGHPLEFGAFITPAAADPDAPVLLAQAAEVGGEDARGDAGAGRRPAAQRDR